MKEKNHDLNHGLQTPGEEIALTARPEIKSKSQMFRYGQSIFCLPHQPKISDFFDLCIHWVFVVRGRNYASKYQTVPSGHLTEYENIGLLLILTF